MPETTTTPPAPVDKEKTETPKPPKEKTPKVETPKPVVEPEVEIVIEPEEEPTKGPKDGLLVAQATRAIELSGTITRADADNAVIMAMKLGVGFSEVEIREEIESQLN